MSSHIHMDELACVLTCISFHQHDDKHAIFSINFGFSFLFSVLIFLLPPALPSFPLPGN